MSQTSYAKTFTYQIRVHVNSKQPMSDVTHKIVLEVVKKKLTAAGQSPACEQHYDIVAYDVEIPQDPQPLGTKVDELTKTVQALVMGLRTSFSAAAAGLDVHFDNEKE